MFNQTIYSGKFVAEPHEDVKLMINASKYPKSLNIINLYGLPLKFFHLDIIKNNLRQIMKLRNNKYLLIEGLLYERHDKQVYTGNRIKKYNCIDVVNNVFCRKTRLRNPSTQLSLWLLIGNLLHSLSDNSQLILKRHDIAVLRQSICPELDVLKQTTYPDDVYEYEALVHANPLSDLFTASDKFVKPLTESENHDLYDFFFSHRLDRWEDVVSFARDGHIDERGKVELRCPLKLRGE